MRKALERSTGKLILRQSPSVGAMRFFHEAAVGKFLMKYVLSFPAISNILTYTKKTSSSKKLIYEFIEEFKINTAEIEKPVESYNNYADFFTRKLKPNARQIATASLVSPVDAELTLIENIENKTEFQIKGTTFNLAQVLNDEKFAKEYEGGSIAIFYLSVQDYHRFHFPANLDWLEYRIVGNKLLSVSPLSLENGFRPFDINVRSINKMRSENGKNFVMMEVGAFYVGHIVQTEKPGASKKKGSEKGFFGLGASTIILLFRKNDITWDHDLVAEKNHPIFVRMGEGLGTL